MSKYGIIIIGFLLFLLAPGSIWAELLALNDAELEKISAQTGFTTKFPNIMDLALKKGDGYLALSTGDTRYLSFTGLSMDGYLLPEYKDQNFNIELINSNSFQIEMESLKLIEINSLDTEIRLGTSPGQGDSMGTLYINGFNTEVSGKVNISFY